MSNNTLYIACIDLTGKRALVAGVADDGGYGFAIAKSLAEAGASVVVGTWPPALTIFMNLLERGKMDESTTRNASMPITRHSESTTASGSFASPMRQVPDG